MSTALSNLIRVVVGAVVLLGVSATAASAQTANVKIGTNLPVGLKIYVSVGGDGANCTGAATAVVGSNGTATVEVQMHCAPSGQRPPTTGPNTKCKMMARGLDEKNDVMYAGSGGITATAVANVYQSNFSLRVVPPEPGAEPRPR
jgi:predicted S18 family serine protease